jgi:hypothetical protein
MNNYIVSGAEALMYETTWTLFFQPHLRVHNTFNHYRVAGLYAGPVPWQSSSGKSSRSNQTAPEIVWMIEADNDLDLKCR